ncbi:hypothetical protein amad1_09555 [Alteromonas mediterranea DE1]|jgi:hypothetical protein|nr:hypothetical protein amad1_09555 [Alteromonas mediterranea DE1]AGP89609.1 hypothetical protein I876_08730 [Alteromonas mediterranea U7]AGP97430.1 hypothetical protein I635_09540 [Alteromonas mediterranea UM7]|tara:strand:- start:6 stop:113 length:108 start_codon:yes stop_codon:yes gene_type:complete
MLEELGTINFIELTALQTGATKNYNEGYDTRRYPT